MEIDGARATDARLFGCLESIAEQTRAPYEVIVVDNGSTDDSIRLIQTARPDTIIIQFSANRGFAAAVNAGIQRASGALVFLLNNDTRLEKGCLELLRKRLLISDTIGSVACRMVNYYDHGVLDGTGDMLSLSGIPATRGFGEPNDGRYSRSDEVFGVCAGAALYRQSMFAKVGLFDEDFVSYYEDADIAFRARLMGFRSLYEPDAICYHKRGATGILMAQQQARLERNQILYLAKNIPAGMLVPLLPVLVASRIRHWIRAGLNGSLREVLRGFGQGIACLPQAREKRRVIQRSRSVPVSELRKWLGKKSAP